MTKNKISINKIFGKKVREHRIAKGWSQDELAHRANLHRTYIGGVERSERNVTLLTVEKIAKALDLDTREFFDE